VDIGGTFDDHGEGVPEKNDWTGTHVLGLSTYFWPSNNWKHLRQANYVVVEQSEKVIKISRWTFTELVAQREIKKGEIEGYSCTTSGITLNRPGHSSDDNFLGYANRIVTLFKDTKGSIILKLENSGGGVFAILPIYIGDTLWRRYPPFHSP